MLYHPDSSLKLEVLVDDETVWLTQAQMADLFQTTKQNIGIHINNAFKEGELENDSVVKESFTTAPNGKSYRTRYYNLDVIISVGYRVKSLRGTIFRRWATKTLKEYILKGYAINQRFERVEYRLAEHDKKIDFFVSSSLPPVERVFYEGQFFDAYAFVADLIKSAKESIVLLDNYVDESVLLLLSKRSSGVPAEIFTRDISPQLRLDINKHNKQFEPAIVRVSDKFHDRYLIIDHTVYIFGSSLKDLGKKRFTFIKLETKDEDILEGL
ncbi:hypothetical protein Mpt1_c12440 [Candidatus Methanoplasma termitum]|uniref:DNA-binding protein n=1 Tax=Candidatus Methanoplasma termitum TaxID=1577791 RepID=A0A0A7LHZ9_9ARCH|nr:RhuM family protein [Candidatus Methanoplasma termitum]AIZ57106.1 hypothetical protein Mpt1_c12440 [Candidatus Methanoplasma termitum]